MYSYVIHINKTKIKQTLFTTQKLIKKQNLKGSLFSI